MKQILPTKTPGLTVNVLLFEAFSNMILACLLEPLRVVRDEARAEIVWRIFTQDDRQIRSSSGLTITADQPLAQAEPCDLLLIIGGDRFRTDAVDPTLLRSLRLTRTADMVIAADTAAWHLAAAGYLNGRRATLHWQLLTEFAETFPDTTAVSAPYVSDGRWVSCGSAAAALELILREISVRFGQAARFDAAAMFSNDPSRPFDTDPVLAAALMHPNAKVRQVLGLMTANVAKPLALPRHCKLNAAKPRFWSTGSVHSA